MMNFQLYLSPSKYRQLRLLRPDVVWQQKTRFLGTAVARDISSNDRSRKKISLHERKLMVEEYVNKYRMMNAGKYPTATDVQKQVGGSYHRCKVILQELPYDSKLYTMATAAKNSTIGKTARVNGTSDARVIPDCKVSTNRTAVVEECGIYEDSWQKMIDMPTLNKNHEITAGYVPRSERKVELELGLEHERISADTDKSDTARNLESQLVPKVSSLVDNTSAIETPMVMARYDSELPAKPGQPSEVTGTSRRPKPGDIDETSYESLGSDKFTRFLGTAAVRDIPNNGRIRKKISRHERFAMVKEYVNKYRMMNAGKDPSVTNVRKEVGGSYHTIKVILQEWAYNSKLSDMATAAQSSIREQTAQVHGTSDARVIPGCEVSNNRTAVLEECGISAECSSSYESVKDKDSCQKLVDISTLNKNHEITEEYVSGSERKVDELGGEYERISADTDMSDTNRNLESQAVPVITSSVKNTYANDNQIAIVMEDSKLPAKPGQPSEATGTSRGQKPANIDEASYQALESDKFTRLMHVGDLSNVIDSKKQVRDPDSVSIQALDINSEVESTRDCQMRVVRTANVDGYQVFGGNDSRSQMEVDNYDCQKTIVASILIKSNKVTAEDFCRSERKAIASVNTSTTNDSEYSVKPSHLSGVSSTSQNTEIGNIKEAFSQGSKCEEMSRVTRTQKTEDKELQKSTLWGNLKSFASNIISVWRKI